MLQAVAALGAAGCAGYSRFAVPGRGVPRAPREARPLVLSFREIRVKGALRGTQAGWCPVVS